MTAVQLLVSQQLCIYQLLPICFRFSKQLRHSLYHITLQTMPFYTAGLWSMLAIFTIIMPIMPEYALVSCTLCTGLVRLLLVKRLNVWPAHVASV